MFDTSSFKSNSTSPSCLQMTEEEFEPYVRRKRAESANRKKMQGLNEQEQNMLRNSINSRERRRMHELNHEYELLRNCLQIDSSSSSGRLSKATTLMLATNRITNLTNNLKVLEAELKKVLAENALLKLRLEELSKSAERAKKCTKCHQSACFSVECLTSS
ncbi:unnamed protein product [Caenorhabditis bovis]|uniref:BHLH domain-containing protein n=1 Tax=Caenorhabditis bovis TaxID=2654633 RepID=A0A8S1F0Q9_9PELO|nr:unnamed protein product [Caenorhabditis bovis]